MRYAAIALAVLLSGCTTFVDKVTDVSGEAGYREVVGKSFVTASPVFVFKLEGGSEIYLEEPGTSTMPDLKNAPQSFPSKYYNTEILGLLPAGFMFRVDRAIYTKSFEQSSVKYKAIISSDGPFKDKEIDPTWLTDLAAYPNPPKFDEKYVVPTK